ncbi:hypothetical protein ACFFKU_01190 [Kineococcus gynurae]|uniref:Uncharacterized protein n=1 Tax=Kineococcus gynurae TaxID=452979 RepID=A0ABV5LQ09_9ACTN
MRTTVAAIVAAAVFAGGCAFVLPDLDGALAALGLGAGPRAGGSSTSSSVVYLGPDGGSGGAGFLDGPLLPTGHDHLPAGTRDQLARLQPCFVMVVGGAGSVSDSVLLEAESYADPRAPGCQPE